MCHSMLACQQVSDPSWKGEFYEIAARKEQASSVSYPMQQQVVLMGQYGGWMRWLIEMEQA